MVDQEESKKKEGLNWHLEKTISITHLFSTIAAIAALVVLGSRFDTRLTVLENSIHNQAQFNKQLLEDSAAQRADVREDLRAISDKLDRLIEKRQ